MCDWLIGTDRKFRQDDSKLMLFPVTVRRRTLSIDAAEPYNKDISARRAAYERLMQAQEPVLLRVARSLCQGDEDQAQDLAQETLLRAYVSYCEGHFAEGTNARAWMLRILTNLFIDDYHRRKRRREGISLDSLTAGGERAPEALRIPSEELPGAALLAEVLDEPLERALASLTPPLRACVILVFMEGMEYREAAQALGIPIGTVRSRLARARQLLQEKLAGYARGRKWK